MATLSPEIMQQFVQLLTPVIGGSEMARRAAISAAFGPTHPLNNQINYSGADGVYVTNLITILHHFGEIERGRPALWVLLESIRDRVGYDWQQKIDAFRPLLTGSAPAAKATPAQADGQRRKLFISYRRKTWAFTHRLGDDLSRALPDTDIFIDLEGVDQTRFEEAIMGHLRSSHGVLVIVSPETFGEGIHKADDWVRKEIAEALRLNKPIIQVGVQGLYAPSSGLPADIQEIAQMQGISIYPDYWHPGVQKLADFIKTVVPITPIAPYVEPPRRDPAPVAPQRQPEPVIEALPAQKSLTFAELLREANTLRTEGKRDSNLEKLEKAKFLLETALADKRIAPSLIDGAQRALRTITQEYDELRTRLEAEQQEAERLQKIDEHVGTVEVFLEFGDIEEAKRQWRRMLAAYPTFTSGHPKYPRKLADQFPPELGDRWTEPKSGLTMVYVPPGEFLMGSTPAQAEAAFEQAKRDYKDSKKEWFDWEVPQHRVRITRGFWLGLTPITNAMYAKFVSDGGYTTQSYWTPEGWQWKGNRTGPNDYDGFTAPDQPRVGVTWYEAVAFCNWAGLRLPTEAEWEFAARGPNSLIYPWGNDFDANRVIYTGNSGGKTHPVGEGIRAAGASWCGALDMSGTVWEWVADWFAANYYASSPTDDPSGPASGQYRVLRGGSWYDDDYGARGAFRVRNTPEFRNVNRGFRCARF